MSFWNGIFGDISQAGVQQQQQNQQGTAGQAYGGYYQQGIGGGLFQGTTYLPPIEYLPMYPIAITHRASGRKLIIWED